MIVHIPIDKLEVDENRIRQSLKDEEQIKVMRDSILRIGISNPLIIRNSKILDGGLRYKILKELHSKWPKNPTYSQVKCVSINKDQEIKELKKELENKDGYYYDTAADRANQLGLQADSTSVKVGRAIREGRFSKEEVKKYRDGELTRDYFLKKLEDKPKFNADDWL